MKNHRATSRNVIVSSTAGYLFPIRFATRIIIRFMDETVSETPFETDVDTEPDGVFDSEFHTTRNKKTSYKAAWCEAAPELLQSGFERWKMGRWPNIVRLLLCCA